MLLDNKRAAFDGDFKCDVTESLMEKPASTLHTLLRVIQGVVANVTAP